MKHISYILLGLTLILGGFLRIYNLSGAPPSLNWDEAALGYNAYSISETLKDEYGKTLPIFTRSFDDYKSAIPVYLIIPSIKIFGLNEFAVRFPSAFLGTLSIILIFFLTRELLGKKEYALLASFLFAIEPWSVHLSRIYHEATVALFFLLLGFLFWIYAYKKRQLLPLSIVSFMLSMYTYHSNKLLIPLFLSSLVFLNRAKLAAFPKNIKFVSILIFLFFAIPFVVLALLGQVFARAGSTNIFILWPKTQVLQSLLEWYRFDGLLEFFVHNQYFYFVWEVVGRYIAYFSPHNLFLREPQEPVTIVAGNSIFYPFEFIPWLVGLLYLIKNAQKHRKLFALLVLAPLPAILTWNWFQPGRTMALFAVFSILIGVGIIKIIEYISGVFGRVINSLLTQKVFISSVVIYGLISAFYLFDSINVQLPTRDLGNWQPGFKETVPVVMSLEKDYRQVIIETPQAQPYIFYLFYGKYSPERYRKELDLGKIGTPRKLYDFGKFKFRKIYWPEDRNLKNKLFVGSEENLPQKDIETQPGVKVITLIKDRWGNIIHKLVATE